MRVNWLVVGATLAATAVLLGAFGAHALKASLSSYHLNVFETGVRYHMYHALALIAVGLGHHQLSQKWATVAGWSFLLGILVFSGSLYMLAVTDMRWLGAITPIGGICLVIAWISLAWAAIVARGTEP